MIKITINTENAAFEGYSWQIELARILREIAKDTEDGHQKKFYRDINGNIVCNIELI